MNKIESANQLNTFLGGVVKLAGLKLKYRITVDPPLGETATGNGRRFWSNSPALILRCCSNAAPNYCAQWNCWPWKCSICPATSTRRSISIAWGTERRGSKNCDCPRALLPKKSGTVGVPFEFGPVCRRASAALFTWRCAMKQDLRTESSGEGIAALGGACIRRTTSPFRSRNSGGDGSSSPTSRPGGTLDNSPPLQRWDSNRPSP